MGGGKGKEALRSDAVAALWKLWSWRRRPVTSKLLRIQAYKLHSLQHR